MTTTEKFLALGVLIAIVIAIGAWFLAGQPHTYSFGTASAVGSSLVPTTLSGGSTPTLVSAFEAGESVISDGPSYFLGASNYGASVTGTLLNVQYSTGSCNTGSSTLFALKPPSGATSTVAFLSTQGKVAQTSDFIVGTSTAAGGMTATSTLNVTGSGGLFGAAAVATGQFYAVAGFKVGPGTGYTTLGNGPYGSQSGIVVGPNEYLVGYATSTAVTGGNGATLCSYKIEWYQ